MWYFSFAWISWSQLTTQSPKVPDFKTTFSQPSFLTLARYLESVYQLDQSTSKAPKKSFQPHPQPHRPPSPTANVQFFHSQLPSLLMQLHLASQAILQVLDEMTVVFWWWFIHVHPSQGISCKGNMYLPGQYYTLKLTASLPQKNNKTKVISQPSIFGCELFVLGHAPTNQTPINHWLKWQAFYSLDL